jgi:hypothetical protein
MTAQGVILPRPSARALPIERPAPRLSRWREPSILPGFPLAAREPLACPFAGLSDFFFPIPRRRAGRQGMDQSMRGRRHFVDRTVERRFVRARRAIRATQLADELKGRRADLVVGRRRRKIRESLDIPEHGHTPSDIFIGAPSERPFIEAPSGRQA